MVFIPPHAKKQMEQRGIDEMEVLEAIKNCEVIFEETNKRFGVKKYSKLPLGLRSLIVVWIINEQGQEEVVTAYWRRNKKWDR